MRLMLGANNKPILLVEVGIWTKKAPSTNFDFLVVNGEWEGTYTNGYVTARGCPDGSFISLDKVEIISDDQNTLNGDYNDVFSKFHNENITGGQ